MRSAQSDRNLLVGILALQMDLVGRDELVRGMNAWVLAKHKPLGEVLEEAGALSSSDRLLLEAIVERQVTAHGGDPARGLESVRPAVAVYATMASISDPAVRDRLAELPSALSGSPHDPYATRVGPLASSPAGSQRFQVLRPHAKGGLGRVSVALDRELGREVAYKEIREDQADRPISRQRFLLEAEVTGGLEHPGIVPVYSLGQDPAGQPYYAMRFIRGEELGRSIERFHAAGARSSRDRFASIAFRDLLGRLLDVCDAISYAHDRGVLHRDLKPGNIMLGKYGETLVVDWGLARLSDDATDETSEVPLRPASADSSEGTVAGTAVGTPGYMSPEQAEGRLDLLAPPTDVYALGCILYAILTGKPAFEDPDPEARLARTRDGDFPRPRLIVSSVPKPLEAVCLKAMALAPIDRYTSARAFADDLRRWMADAPVSARRESLGERTARWARRHRAALLAAGSILLAAVAALSVVTVVVLDLNAQVEGERANAEAARREETAARILEQNARAAAQDAEAKALTEARTAQTTSLFMEGLFEASDPISFSGVSWLRGRDESPSDLTVRTILERGSERIRTELENEPLARARLMDTLGNVSRSLAAFDQAEPLLVEALRIRRQLLPSDSPELADTLIHLGWLYQDQSKYEKAEPLYREALAIRERLSPAEDDPEVARIVMQLGWLLADAVDPAAAPVLRRAISTYRGLPGRNRELALAEFGLVAHLLDTRQPRWAEISTLIADAHKQMASEPDMKTTGEALAKFQSGVFLRDVTLLPAAVRLRASESALRESLALAEPALGRLHPYVGYISFELAKTLEEAGKDEEAGAEYEHCLEIVREIPQLGLAHFRVQNLGLAYAQFMRRAGRPEAGLRFLEEMVAAEVKYYGPEHPVTVSGRWTIAIYFAEAGRNGEALPLLRGLVATIQSRPTERWLYRDRILASLAVVLYRLSLHDEAEPLLAEALERDRSAAYLDIQERADLNHTLASLELLRRRPERAEPYIRAGIAADEQLGRSSDTDRLLDPIDTLAELQVATGQIELAERTAREHIITAARRFGPNSLRKARGLHTLSLILLERGRPVEALDSAREALDTIRANRAARPSDRLDADRAMALAALVAGDAVAYREAVADSHSALMSAGADGQAALRPVFVWIGSLGPGAFEDYRPILGFAGELSRSPSDVELRFISAALRFRAGDIPGAASLLNGDATSDPNRPNAARLVVEAFLAMEYGQGERARDLLARARAECRPPSPGALPPGRSLSWRDRHEINLLIDEAERALGSAITSDVGWADRSFPEQPFAR